MKVSTKGRYGLRALVDLAAHMEGDPVPLVAVAGRQKISLNYLEQVFGQLRKAGIVKSIKGPNGGYLLSRAANTFTIKEILEVLEGPFSITDGILEGEMDTLRRTLQRLVFDEIDRRVNTFLEGRTLEQLVDEYKQQEKGRANMYYI